MTSDSTTDIAGPPMAEQAYLFRHAVVRDAAYSLQLPGERALLHALALRVLEALTSADQLPHTAAVMAEHARLAREGGIEPEAMRASEERHLAAAVAYANTRDDLPELLVLATQRAELPGAAPRDRIEALVLAGQAALGLGRRDLAEQLARQMLETATGMDDAVQVGRAYRALSTVQQIKGQGEDSARHIRQSIEILERAGDRRELANSLIGAGFFAMIYGRNAEAREHIQRALQLSDEFPFEKSKALRAMGDTLMRTGDYEAALESFRKSIETLPAHLPRHHTVAARKGVAFALSRMGRLDEAAHELSQLLQQALKAGRYTDALNCTTLLGEIEVDKGELEHAEAHMRSALRLASEGGRHESALALGNLGGLLVRRGKLAEADAMLQESLRLRNPATPEADMVSVSFHLAELRFQQGRHDEARQHYASCTELGARFGDSRYAERVRARFDVLDQRG